MYDSTQAELERLAEDAATARRAQWDEFRTAGAELLARAKRAEASIARVRSYIASQTAAMPEGYPVAVPAADVLAAIDGPSANLGTAS